MFHRADTAQPEVSNARDQEQALVAAVRRGDGSAFRRLYDAFHNRVYRLAIYSLGDAAQAQDVVQTVFLKIYTSIGKFRFQSRLSTWIFRIAHNECQNHHRNRRPSHVQLESILGSPEEIDARPGFHDQFARREREAILREALAQLPFKMREAIVLRYVEGLSYEEMGCVLSCAPGTVASRLSRALAALEDRLRPFRNVI